MVHSTKWLQLTEKTENISLLPFPKDKLFPPICLFLKKVLVLFLERIIICELSKIIFFSSFTKRTTENVFSVELHPLVYTLDGCFSPRALLPLTHFCVRGSKAELMARLLACSHCLIEKAPSALHLAAFICPIYFCSNITWATSDS